MFKFKANHSFEQRASEAARIRAKYRDRIPVIVEKAPRSDISDLDKHKFLVPNDLRVGQFLFILHKRLSLVENKSIFLFSNGILLSSSASMADMHQKYSDNDGFLYILYAAENTFG